MDRNNWSLSQCVTDCLWELLSEACLRGRIQQALGSSAAALSRHLDEQSHVLGLVSWVLSGGDKYADTGGGKVWG